MVLHWQRQKADDTSHELLQMRTTPMTYRFIVNTLARAESMLHSLENAAGGIGLHVNKDKMEYSCFNQRGDISILNGGSLKLVDKFTYLGSSVSSTENDISTR